MNFKKIVICGVGLIGGSLSLALKKANYQASIVGLERNQQVLECAYNLGLVDNKNLSISETFDQADLLVLAVPVAQTANVLRHVLPYLPKNILITDTGSTKSDVVAMAREVLGEKVSHFIAAHPIAGREKNGPDSAISDLFVDRKTVITPIKENSQDDVKKIAELWQICQSVVHYLTPENHDTVFATVSHMPHILAYGLVDYVAKHDKSELFFEYAASGFRDFTRIASSSSEMWRDITMANRAHLLNELNAYLKEISDIRDMVANADAKAIEAIYENARQARMKWLNTIEKSEKNK